MEGNIIPGMFSVVIPTYNRKEKLYRCIQSVLNGTFKDLEIIVVDDGSTDGSKDLVESNFPGIRYVMQNNKGVSAARNRGLSLARGEFIALLDSDDTWHPDRLAFYSKAMAELPAEVGVVFNDMDQLVDGSPTCQSIQARYFEKSADKDFRKMCGEKRIRFDEKYLSLKYGWIFPSLIQGNVIQPSCAIMRRTVYEEVGGFREDLRTANDTEFFLRVSERFQVGYIPRILTALELPHEAISLSKPFNNTEKVRNTLMVISEYLNRAYKPEPQVREILMRRQCELASLLGYHYISNFQGRKFRHEVLPANRACLTKMGPVFRIRTYLLILLSFLPAKALRGLFVLKRCGRRFKYWVNGVNNVSVCDIHG